MITRPLYLLPSTPRARYMVLYDYAPFIPPPLYTPQVLHVIWFCMIMRMVYRYVIVGIIEKDDRSETEPDTNSDDESVLDARRDASDARHYDVRRRKMTANNNTDTTS